jgi:hypothetical protein
VIAIGVDVTVGGRLVEVGKGAVGEADRTGKFGAPPEQAGSRTSKTKIKARFKVGILLIIPDMLLRIAADALDNFVFSGNAPLAQL